MPVQTFLRPTRVTWAVVLAPVVLVPMLSLLRFNATLFLLGFFVIDLKGRRPIIRGEVSLAVTPRAFLNPAAASHLSAHTGGSRGEGVPIPVDLAWVRDRAVRLPVAFDALGWGGGRVAVWGVPGAAAMVRILEYAAAGARPERWFSPVRPDSPGYQLVEDEAPDGQPGSASWSTLGWVRSIPPRWWTRSCGASARTGAPSKSANSRGGACGSSSWSGARR